MPATSAPVTCPDPRVRHYIAPVRVVWQSAGPAAPRGADLLLGQTHPTRRLWPTAGCTLEFAENPGGILLDFGRELHGSIRLMASATGDRQPVRLRVRLGESVSEAMGLPNLDHAPHDWIATVPNCGAVEVGHSGFRFARLDLVTPGSSVVLAAVQAVSLMHDAPRLGRFACSDERLDRIWRVGADTVHLCMQDLVWDGIKRDRLVWAGDLHPECRVIADVFGPHPIVPQSLDWVRDTAPLPEWMNGIPTYSMWWVIIHHEWYRQFGDRAYLEQQRAYLSGLLDQLAAQVGPDGREAVQGWRFLDWPTEGDAAGVHAGIQALLGWSLAAGADLCLALGADAAAERATAARRRLLTCRPAADHNKRVTGLLAVAGLADPADVNRRVLAVEPTAGLSTFYGYYVLQARALAGDVRGALDVIRTYWGAMLDLGATSFWEDFDLRWAANAGRIDELPQPGRADIHADFGAHCYKGLRHSLCHGWAAGPTAWLSEQVLGVQWRSPGGRQVRVQPQLGDLAWARGAIPTAHGLIEVEAERTPGGEVRARVVLPDGVERI